MRTLWLTAPMGGDVWSVYLASADDPALRPAKADECADEGITLREERVILINRDLPRSAWAGVLMHELIHGGALSSGLRSTMRLSEAREEHLASVLAPVLAQFLTASRLLRLPRAPR